MSRDLRELAKQIGSKYPTQNALGELMSTFYRKDQETLNALLVSTNPIPSLMEELIRQQQQFSHNFQEELSSPAQTALEALFGHNDREVQRIEQAIGSRLTDELDAHRQFLQHLSYTIEPVHEMLDRIKSDYAVPAPWLEQLRTAADHTAAFLGALSNDDSSEEDATYWVELDKHLSEFDAAIEQLPPGDASEAQVRAAGMSVIDQFTLIISLLSLLFGILSYVETLRQGQLSRQQHAVDAVSQARADEEERAFRHRLIASIDAVAQRIPTQRLQYVVGPRPTAVRSTPGEGLVLGRIHANQVVVVTGHKGRWMKVAYRDHLDERDVEGWVLKHYLVQGGAGVR